MHAMTPTFQPYRESWRRTLTRTITIALVVGGVGLGAGITWSTARFAVTRGLPTASWWGAGLAFIGVELVAHAVLAARRHPSFYDGTG